MRPEPRAIRSVVSCACLLAAVAGGCNALIGLEVGELAPSESSADAASASSSGGPGTGGSGAGGEGAGGAGAGGAGGDSGGGGSGGGGSSGDGGGGGGGSGGGGPLCSDAEGTLVEPSASWGATLGFDVGDLATSDGALTAVITEVLASGAFRFSVAKWTSGGTNDSRYGLSANDVWGLHLAASGGATYVAGEAAGATNLPGGLLDACRVGPPLVATSYTTSFVAALDANGRCGWAWSLDAQHNTTARAMAASSEAVVFAVDVSDAGRSFGPCELKSVPAESALLAALYPADGACKWQHRLGPRAAVTVKALPVNPKAAGNLVTVVGDYESLEGAVTFGGDTPFAAEQRDVFVARYAAISGALVDVTTLSLEGDQQVAQHGAALLPGGDVVIVGSYRGVVDFGGGCPALPDAGDTENFFVARVSRKGVVWSRGFGDGKESQVAAGVAVDGAGAIYVTGEFTGAIPLGSAGSLTTSQKRAGFLMRLDAQGNLISAAKVEGAGTVALRVVAVDGALGGPVYVAGTVTGALHLDGLDTPLGSESDNESRGFIARLSGAR
ncbi:hypothetical protein [Sorangium atrum]|uniref:Cell surface protein n=1 Tax=Sorangium atrum TaxID=2995308 RepID=A0ABT5BWE4_9BACT|nr:hypothetical protein [Sorangium aterium]MDC0677834.1 hypothetical protein [Sorangium aterium]